MLLWLLLTLSLTSSLANKSSFPLPAFVDTDLVVDAALFVLLRAKLRRPSPPLMVDNIERLLLEVDAPGIAVNDAVENELIIARIVVLPPPRLLEKRNGFLLEV